MKLLENSFQAFQKEIFLAVQEAFFFYYYYYLARFLLLDIMSRVNICFRNPACHSNSGGMAGGTKMKVVLTFQAAQWTSRMFHGSGLSFSSLVKISLPLEIIPPPAGAAYT